MKKFLLGIRELFEKKCKPKNNLDEVLEGDLDHFLQSSVKAFVNPPKRDERDSINVGDFFDMFTEPLERKI